MRMSPLPLVLLLAASFLLPAPDVLSERTYIQALAIRGNTLILQPFEAEENLTVQEASPEQALCIAEIKAGGKVFLGHTELVCLSSPEDLPTLQKLLDEGISPTCQVVLAPPETLSPHAGDVHYRQIRTAQRNGAFPPADLQAVLNSGVVYALPEV